MTDTIKRLRDLDAAATKGPWTWDEKWGVYARGVSDPIVENDSGVYPPHGADGPLIAESRNAIAKLLDVVEAARKVVDEKQAWPDGSWALDALIDELAGQLRALDAP